MTVFDDDDLVARGRVYELADELGIDSLAVRAELLSDPRRAVLVLNRALRARGIRNRAAFAIASWRSRVTVTPSSYEPQARRDAGAPADDLDQTSAGPPQLAELERIWSLPETPIRDAMLAAMGAAISKAGGFAVLRPPH